MKKKKLLKRPGYTTVSPYLLVENVADQIEFIRSVFQTETIEDADQNPDGHAEIKIGDTTIMLGAGRPEWPVRQSMNYVYVEDVHAIYARAMACGAKSLCEPTERYYGDRECGFEDKYGNQWWCATYVETLSKEEIHSRFERTNR